MTQERLFKVLAADGSACHGGTGKWSLPEGDESGAWMPPIEGELIPCENGYHLCRTTDLLRWPGPAIYGAEYRGAIVAAEDKVVVREARLSRRLAWDERTARLFACDCAERVLHVFEAAQPGDVRPREAIAVGRRYANGEATEAELTAAEAAAGDAARDVAGDAAWAAAGAAAWDAAWAAAWAAAGAAAGDAALAAAGDAAGDVAKDAARAAAGDAARDAAGDAARDAAWAAAKDAEMTWQRERLLQYLDGAA